MVHLRFGPIEVSTSSPTVADLEATKDEQHRVDELAVRVPRFVTPRRYRLAVGQIVTDWGFEPVQQFAAGWPTADGPALAKLLMQANRLRRGNPVDVEELLSKTHAEARIDAEGRLRRKFT